MGRPKFAGTPEERKVHERRLEAASWLRRKAAGTIKKRPHSQADKVRQAKLRHGRKTLGLCEQCGAPSNGYAFCRRHSSTYMLGSSNRSDRRQHGIEHKALDWALLNHRLRFEPE